MRLFLRLTLLLASAVAVSAVGRPAADPTLRSWPAGSSPQEIGRRVAENLIPRPHMLIGPDNVVHYAEVCTWYGALRFAQVTGDRALTAKLEARFEPLFSTEARLVPRAINVDNAVFGAVPL